MADHIDAITEERGKRYGSPLDHFSCTGLMFGIWYKRYIKHNRPQQPVDPHAEAAFLHAVHMIFDKLARAASDPLYRDNWDDIEGYVRCLKTFMPFPKQPSALDLEGPPV